MADHSKHEHTCGCGEKTRATQLAKPDFTFDPAKTKAHEAACCGDHAEQSHGDNQGCCGGSQPKTKAGPDSGAGGCCGGHSND